jgi:hypothetical protein
MDMKNTAQSQSQLVTMPLAWLADLLDRIPEQCSICRKVKPGAEVSIGRRNICDDCAKAKK